MYLQARLPADRGRCVTIVRWLREPHLLFLSSARVAVAVCAA